MLAIACFDFTCLIAVLVGVPRANEHLDLGYYLLVSGAHCVAPPPKVRIVLNLDK